MTAVALPASAAMDSGAPSVTVRFNDLNLSTEAGTQVLLHRLKYAARQVCGEVNPRELTRYTQIQACYRQAIGTAVNSIHNEHLTALYGTPKGSGAT
jgi:UrcA family protein